MEDISKVTHGPYGWYYPYKDEKGKDHGLKIFDEIYEKYYMTGYLKDIHLEEMILGKVITFNVPKKDGSGERPITAKLVDYTTKAGRHCKIIQFESDKVDDTIIIKSNLEKIALSYWNSGRFNYMKPQEVLNNLDLDNEWKTYATYEKLSALEIDVGTIKIYRPRSRKDDDLVTYCKVEADKCEMIDEATYKSLVAKNEETRKEIDRKYLESAEKVSTLRNTLRNWIESIETEINANGKVDYDKLEDLVYDVSIPNFDNRLSGYLVSRYAKTAKDYINNAKSSVLKITSHNCDNPEEIDKITSEIKNTLLCNLKIWLEYVKLISIRSILFSDYQAVGLEALTESIDIDTALSLGYFPTVKKILVKYGKGAPEYIIFNLYREELNAEILKDKLLNILKIYYDFYDMPEKDRKSIAKFIAKNNIKEYYNKIKEYDDVLETLIDNSRDPRLTKPLLESIAGTSRAAILKDKTFYFEKRGWLRNEILLYKPIELVDELRKCIKEFNVSSNVAILTNIELDSDESFIFQFYTFADSEGDDKGFDGRRMLNLTRIYNRTHPKERIGFYFNNGDVDSMEEV